MPAITATAAFAPSLPAAPVAPLTNRLPAARRVLACAVVVSSPRTARRRSSLLRRLAGGSGGDARDGNGGYGGSWWGGWGRDDSGGHSHRGATLAATGLLARYSNELVRRPYRTKAVTTGLLMLLADYLAQTLTQPTLEVPRLLRYLFYGTLFAGPVTHWWFSLIERHCARGVVGAVQMATLDQLVGAPLFLACFVLFMHLAEGGRIAGNENALREQHASAYAASCRIWPWVNTFNFAVVPSHYRVVFGSAFNVAWIAFLSVANANASARRDTVLADATG